MPANTSPEFKKAEIEYRQARDSADRLRCLREMLRTIPKHKGTEHLQADIKTRIKHLTEEISGPRKGGARTGPAQVVRPEGAAQVSLIGPPNAGKSSLLARLTGAHSEVGTYPGTTRFPVPGMLPHEDVHFQLVDLPPISASYQEPWFANALQPADAALLVIDLADPESTDHLLAIRELLETKRVTLSETWPAGPAAAPPAPIPDDEAPDPFRIVLPTLLVANKSDLDPEPGEVDVLEDLLGVRYPAVSVSARTGSNLDRIAPFLFSGLGVIRVYTKSPGRRADRDRPYTVRPGATVHDVARLVHKEIASGLRFARVWGSGQFEGQQVGPDHPVADGDIIEIH